MILRRKIKILRIQSRICIGGPAIHTEILSKYMPTNVYDTILIGGALDAEERSKYEEIKARGINIRILGQMKRSLNPAQDFYAIIKMYLMMRREKPDIVCTHTAKAGTIGRISAILAGVPVVLHTFHGHVFEGYFGKFKANFFISVERILARLTDHVVAISPSQYNDLLYKYQITGAGKISMIRLGLELEKFLSVTHNGSLKKGLGLPADHIIIAHIGRLVPIKNNKMMLHVLSRLIEKIPTIHLCIIGDGEDRKQLEELAQQIGISDRVHFLGWVADLERIYSGVDLVALTSRNEGTPMTLIEAMASSVPVVATNVGGVPDLLFANENGLLCGSNDAVDMADKIVNLLTNANLRTRITRSAKKFVAENYQYSRLINELDLLYRRLLSAKGYQVDGACNKKQN
jgi:glycosyltransferase involved in cell wall biosynthesis